jgi:hypothetical protein
VVAKDVFLGKHIYDIKKFNGHYFIAYVTRPNNSVDNMTKIGIMKSSSIGSGWIDLGIQLVAEDIYMSGVGHEQLIYDPFIQYYNGDYYMMYTASYGDEALTGVNCEIRLAKLLNKNLFN